MKDKIIEILKNNTVIRGDVGLPVITINYEKATTELEQLLSSFSDYKRVDASVRLPDRLLSAKNKYSRVSEHLHLITESNLKCTGHYDFIDKRWYIDTYEAIEAPKYWLEPTDNNKVVQPKTEQSAEEWLKENYPWDGKTPQGIGFEELVDMLNQFAQSKQSNNHSK